MFKPHFTDFFFFFFTYPLSCFTRKCPQGGGKRLLIRVLKKLEFYCKVNTMLMDTCEAVPFLTPSWFGVIPTSEAHFNHPCILVKLK